jgi:hypothetical protein
MEITDKQKRAGRKVIEVAHLMQLAVREAIREGLVVELGHSHYSRPDTEIRAVVKIEQEQLVAATERQGKK